MEIWKWYMKSFKDVVLRNATHVQNILMNSDYIIFTKVAKFSAQKIAIATLGSNN